VKADADWMLFMLMMAVVAKMNMDEMKRDLFFGFWRLFSYSVSNSNDWMLLLLVVAVVVVVDMVLIRLDLVWFLFEVL